MLKQYQLQNHMVNKKTFYIPVQLVILSKCVFTSRKTASIG